MTQPTRDPEEKCTTCGNTWYWHGIHRPRHEFNGSLFAPPTEVTPPRPEPDVKKQTWPFDPVLRMALIDAGVITTAQLDDAEAKIRATTAKVVGDGQQ